MSAGFGEISEAILQSHRPANTNYVGKLGSDVRYPLTEPQQHTLTTIRLCFFTQRGTKMKLAGNAANKYSSSRKILAVDKDARAAKRSQA